MVGFCFARFCCCCADVACSHNCGSGLASACCSLTLIGCQVGVAAVIFCTLAFALAVLLLACVAVVGAASVNVVLSDCPVL